jgi:SMC interacting uncharacterized protein involved in chromosome segregation
MQQIPTILADKETLFALIGFLLTALGWFVLRRPRQTERESLNLQALTTYKDTLFEQVTELQGERDELKDTVKEFETLEDKADNLVAENAKLADRIKIQDVAIKECATKIKSLEDHLFDARVTAQILNQQKYEMARRFNIPTSVSDLER